MNRHLRAFISSNVPEPARCHTELSAPEKLLQRMEGAVSTVGALQDLLTAQLPCAKPRTTYATDFGVGSPPLIGG